MNNITLNLTEAELSILKHAIADLADKTDSPVEEETLNKVYIQLAAA